MFLDLWLQSYYIFFILQRVLPFFLSFVCFFSFMSIFIITFATRNTSSHLFIIYAGPVCG